MQTFYPMLYALSIFLSAFLLFQVQPLIGKYILPWFGGAPTVWSTVLLFFQTLLTAGYAYAYGLLGRLQTRWQGLVHLVMLTLSLALLATALFAWPSPLTPPAAWRPTSSAAPIWNIVRLLAVAAGAPYLLLAANSTLMQAWSHDDQHQRMARTPYRLYALSNAGSLLALVSYPILFEPNLTIPAQGRLWSAGYLIFTALTALLAWRAYQRGRTDAAPAVPAAEAMRPGLGLHALWAGLAACASALLMAVTSHITQEVVVVPFLWVLPLTVYLLTFILAFAGGRAYARRAYLIAFFALSLVSLWALVKFPPFAILTQIAIYLLLLFVASMLCHNELYRLRPSPRNLSAFYLMTAVGGAVGGVFVALLAPVIFVTGFWELQWCLALCAVLLALVLHLEQSPAPRGRAAKARRSGAAPAGGRIRASVALVGGGALFLALLTVLLMRTVGTDTLLAMRNFYGVLRVWEINTRQPEVAAYQMTHGKTAHGFQFEASQIRSVPTTYYAEPSGVGLALAHHPARPGKLRVGALGLGIGVIASYGQDGDIFRFYEINPDVIRLAQGEGGYFTFLSDSAAHIEVVEGDARLALERELAQGGAEPFDLLVLDTFSGDSMPAHLLTREAFDIYWQRLTPEGILAINVSNRYLDLSQVVYGLADALGLQAILIEHAGDRLQSYDSVWMLLTRRPLEIPAIAERVAPRPASTATLPAWTDNFSNLWTILH